MHAFIACLAMRVGHVTHFQPMKLEGVVFWAVSMNYFLLMKGKLIYTHAFFLTRDALMQL